MISLSHMIEYKKSADVLIFNDKGELALQLRALNDKSFPLHWDFSAGGGIDGEEDPKFAAEREVFEELGVKVDVEFISKEHFTYPAWDPTLTRETDVFIYITHHNGPFHPDPKEVEKVEFFRLDKIKEMMESGGKFHPEFVLTWNKGIIVQANDD